MVKATAVSRSVKTAEPKKNIHQRKTSLVTSDKIPHPGTVFSVKPRFAQESLTITPRAQVLSRDPASVRHGLGESSRKAMLVYHWPGNVRELQNIIERALILNVNGHLDVASLLQVQPQREVKPQAGMQVVLTDKAMRDLGKKNILTHLNLPIGKFLAVAVQQNCYKFHPLHAVQESASLE